MATVSVGLLLYLLKYDSSGWCISLRQLHGTGGIGARANGHKGDHHDGLRSLYDFGTLFHGTSTNPKEAGGEVAFELMFLTSIAEESASQFVFPSAGARRFRASYPRLCGGLHFYAASRQKSLRPSYNARPKSWF
jgi:hypothetical protein